jgi:hypothetical protein
MIDAVPNGGYVHQWTLGFHVSAFDGARKRGHGEVLDLMLKIGGLCRKTSSIMSTSPWNAAQCSGMAGPVAAPAWVIKSHQLFRRGDG